VPVQFYSGEVAMVYDQQQVETFIAGFEGRKYKAYYDIAGKLTIGIGHKCLPIEGFTPNTTIGDSKIDQLFQSDIILAARSIDAVVKNLNLTANQNCALLDFEFNLGIGALASSTLLKCINSGDLVGASNQFLKWDHAHVNGVMVEVPALTTRRNAERELFIKDFAGVN
jgi:lysozyme